MGSDTNNCFEGESQYGLWRGLELVFAQKNGKLRALQVWE